MKKQILTSILSSASLFVFAQEKPNQISVPPPPRMEHNLVGSVRQDFLIESLTPLIAMGLLVFFTITLVKYILEHRLKNKIIDRGISEELATSLLEKNQHNKTDDAIKSAILLFGMGMGLVICYYTSPLNLHSLAIMAISIALSYLVYYFYLKSQKR
jgi:hypothetical protein